MRSNQFEQLLSLIKDNIEKKEVKYKESISCLFKVRKHIFYLWFLWTDTLSKNDTYELL